MLHMTDFFLIHFTCEAESTPDFAQPIAAFCAHSPVVIKLQRSAWSGHIQTAYLYFQLATPTRLDASALPALTSLWAQHCPQAQGVKISRLEKVFDRKGHSHAQAPLFHYVVEMDPDEGWMPELERWYDTEHMPGLAAVPGCIRASRLYNHDQGPLSLACYDLLSTETLGSEPWLAVRGTPWSDIVRPHFTNTRRTMFEVLA
jgi:hypothetical protein